MSAAAAKLLKSGGGSSPHEVARSAVPKNSAMAPRSIPTDCSLSSDASPKHTGCARRSAPAIDGQVEELLALGEDAELGPCPDVEADEEP